MKVRDMAARLYCKWIQRPDVASEPERPWIDPCASEIARDAWNAASIFRDTMNAIQYGAGFPGANRREDREDDEQDDAEATA